MAVHRQSDDLLLRAEHLLRSENLFVAYLDAQLRVRHIDAAGLAWLGVQDDAVKGASLSKLLPFCSPELDRIRLEAPVAADRKWDCAFEMFVRGRPALLRLHFFPDIGRDTELAGYAVCGRIDAEASVLERLSTAAALAGGVGQDINNSLGIIAGELDLLLLAHLSAENERRVGRALDATRKAGQVAQSLLGFARRQSMRPAAHRANEVVRVACDAFAKGLPPQVQLDFRPSPTLWPANIDAAQFERALINLLNNAAESMPNGGKVVVSTENASLSDDLVSTEDAIPPGDYVLVAVSDTGIGMSPAVRLRATEPFFTTKSSAEHSGLGLSAAHGIVRQLGGQMRISSAPGKGTTITLYLPRVKALASVEAPQATVATGQLVMVVEDDVGLLETMRDMLRSLGYQVLVAPDSASARNLAVSEPIQCVLIDVMLEAGASGFDLARELAPFLPGVPFVYCSGYVDHSLVPADKVQGVRLLQKPIRRADLRAALAAALA